MLSIHLFGEPRFFLRDQRFRFVARPKVLPLLAYLLLRRSEPIQRQTLAFALWPDESERDARTNLRRHLNYLNKALPRPPAKRPWLLSEPQTIQWNPAADSWFDVAEFERLSGDPKTRAAAIGLYTGDLLENVYDDWLLHERERLRDLLFANLGDLIQQHRAQRDYRRAIDLAQQLLLRDPLREDSLRLLMASYYESGDRASALKAYERFIKRLRDELSVEPMPETVSVHETILREARLPSLAPAIEIKSGDASKGTRLALPFVGRESEMEQLRAHWSRAARGHGGLVLVGGEAGIGKTRLTNELSLIAEREGGRVLYGGATFAEPTPYQVFVEALRSALRLIASAKIESLWLAAISPLFPELPSLRSHLPYLPPLGVEQERARLLEGLSRCLEALAEPRPVLLILDDLHWVSAATLHLLEFIARRAAQHSLLVVATFREEEVLPAHPLRDLRRRLRREHLLAHLALTHLSKQAVESLVHQVEPLKSDGDTLASRLYAQSGGNPFFLGELIRDRLESGNKVEAESVPDGVRQTVMSRVSRLTSPARALAEIAAVIGLAFNVELVSLVGGWREGEVLDLLSELLDRQLIRETAGGTHADYLFNHHLIQSAIYANVPPDTLTRRHRRVAHVMQELYHERQEQLAAEIATHFELGREPSRAADYYLVAAQRTEDLYAHDEALELCQRARRCIEKAESPGRSDVYEMMGDIYFRMGVAPSAIEAFERALALENSRQRKAALKSKLGKACVTTDDPRGLSVLQEALQELDPETQKKELAEASAQVGRYHHLSGEYVQAIQRYERARQLTAALDDANLLVSAYDFLAAASSQLGQIKESMYWSRQSIALGERKRQEMAVARGLENLAEAANLMGDWSEAIEHAERARKIGERIGDQARIAWADLSIANALYGQGRLAEAMKVAQQGLAIAEKIGEVRLKVSLGVTLALIQTDRGIESASVQAGLAAELGESQRLVFRLASKRALAYWHLQRGGWAEATAWYDQIEELYRKTDNRAYLIQTGARQAEAQWGCREFGKANDLIERFLRVASEAGSLHYHGIGLRVRGQVRTRLGLTEEAGRDLNQAVAALDSLGSRLELGRAYFWRGVWRKELSDDAAARRDWAQAHALFQTIGAVKDRERAATLLGSL